MELSLVQQEIIDSGILTTGFNCILQLPTGAGKTFLARQAIKEVVAKGKKAIYLTPLKALAEELRVSWQNDYSKPIGVFTGDYSVYPVSFDEAQLLIMTPERLDACTRNWRSHWGWLPEVDLVVVDEFHLLGDKQRGARLEGALLRMRRLNPFATILGLSATLGNTSELADWLDGVYFISDVRSVPMQWQFKYFKKADQKPGLLLEVVRGNLATGGKSLVFVQSRRRAEEIHKFIYSRGLESAFHHAGMDYEYRQGIEQKFRAGELDVLVATSTLEMGLNLPARQVVLYDLQVFDGQGEFKPLPVNNVWQRAGRAGRPGLDEYGEVVLMMPSWDKFGHNYSKGKFESIKSKLTKTHNLAEQIICEVGSGLARTVTQLESVFNSSLAAHQGNVLPVGEVVQQMIQAGMILQVEDKLKTTKLGWIAMSQMLEPKTVLLMKNALEFGEVTFLDLLIVVASLPDCDLVLRPDYEQLEFIAQQLVMEPSYLLSLHKDDLLELLQCKEKRLLSSIFTALVLREYTRTGNGKLIAEIYNCYPFEIEKLAECVSRLLTAIAAICGILELSKSPDPEAIPIVEKIQCLEIMVSAGVDEYAATLAIIPGLGATLLKRLNEIGIRDIEDLSNAESTVIAKVKGISQVRAAQWIEKANEVVGHRYSANRYKEENILHQNFTSLNFPQAIDPYRLRRALSLTVKRDSDRLFQVTGGLDPHIVSLNNGEFDCDCTDTQQCKHILATRLSLGDSEIQQLLDKRDRSESINILDLWMQ